MKNKTQNGDKDVKTKKNTQTWRKRRKPDKKTTKNVKTEKNDAHTEEKDANRRKRCRMETTMQNKNAKQETNNRSFFAHMHTPAALGVVRFTAARSVMPREKMTNEERRSHSAALQEMRRRLQEVAEAGNPAPVEMYAKANSHKDVQMWL